MDWKEIFNVVVDGCGPIIAVLAQLVICILAVFGIRLIRKLFTKIGIDVDGKIIDEIEDIVRQAVKMVNQKFVDDYKEQSADGKLTEEQKKQVYSIAYNAIMTALTDEQMKVLIDKYGDDLSSAIEIMIESTIADCKTTVEKPVQVPVNEEGGTKDESTSEQADWSTQTPTNEENIDVKDIEVTPIDGNSFFEGQTSFFD